LTELEVWNYQHIKHLPKFLPGWQRQDCSVGLSGCDSSNFCYSQCCLRAIKDNCRQTNTVYKQNWKLSDTATTHSDENKYYFDPSKNQWSCSFKL